MIEPSDQFPEAPSAREAPAIIRLPPPLPMPEPYQPRSGSENRKRRHVKRCRFDDAELAEFERRARARNLSDGAFIRAATLDTPGPRAQRNHRPPPETRLLIRHLTEFNRIGNNLNQTARALKSVTSGSNPPFALASIAASRSSRRARRPAMKRSKSESTAIGKILRIERNRFAVGRG